MSVQAWLLFCVTETVLSFTPGPAVLLVVSLAVAYGPRTGVAASFGVLLANTGFFVASAMGIGSVAGTEAPWWYAVVRTVGAVYLVWLGVQALRAGPAEEATVRPPVGMLRPFGYGLVTQGANPKVFVFFTALLPQFVDPAGSVTDQMWILGVSSVLIELFALCVYAFVAGSAKALAVSPATVTVLRRVGGLLLIASGLGLGTVQLG